MNSIFQFPLSGHAPFVLEWEMFESYFEYMTHTDIVGSLKDFYWDIRPSPRYGTVEVRVMDTPLSIERAAAIAGYIQALSRYLLLERPLNLRDEDYHAYTVNRFMATRYGLQGHCVDPETRERCSIAQHILETADRLRAQAEELGSQEALDTICRIASGQITDADRLRTLYGKQQSLSEVVRQQCIEWRAQ